MAAAVLGRAGEGAAAVQGLAVAVPAGAILGRPVGLDGVTLEAAAQGLVGGRHSLVGECNTKMRKSYQACIL